MCLDRLADFEVPDPGVGWKVFRILPHEFHLHALITTIEYSVFYSWLDAKEVWENFIRGARWPTVSPPNHENGFYIYLNKKDAMKAYRFHIFSGVVIMPVKFRGVKTKGYDGGGFKVVVAKEMMILAEEP